MYFSGTLFIALLGMLLAEPTAMADEGVCCMPGCQVCSSSLCGPNVGFCEGNVVYTTCCAPALSLSGNKMSGVDGASFQFDSVN